MHFIFNKFKFLYLAILISFLILTDLPIYYFLAYSASSSLTKQQSTYCVTQASTHANHSILYACPYYKQLSTASDPPVNLYASASQTLVSCKSSIFRSQKTTVFSYRRTVVYSFPVSPLLITSFFSPIIVNLNSATITFHWSSSFFDGPALSAT